MAGQTIASRVSGDPVASNNGLFNLYSDHLGSISALGDGNGNLVAGSLTRYLPFGEYRGDAPTQTLTDRDFTGQKENRELGLLYYNARYYVPGIGRFASADTIVPDPTNPQSFNRYSYTYNNPLMLIDPSGHCPAPAEGSGNVICVDLFIGDERIIFGTGFGDGRSFDPDSDPSASRGFVYIYLDEMDANGNVRTEVTVNDSGTVFGNFEADDEQNFFEVYLDPETGQIILEYQLRNGFTANAYNNDEAILEQYIECMSNGFYCGEPAGLSGPYASMGIPDINGNILLSPNLWGSYDVSADRDPYPWLEIYQYQDGIHVETLAQLSPSGAGNTPLGPIFGLNPLAPNQTVFISNDKPWWSRGSLGH